MCEHVCESVTEGVINHDLNVDRAAYETTVSRCHLRQLLPYTSQATSTFHMRSNQQGKVQMD